MYMSLLLQVNIFSVIWIFNKSLISRFFYNREKREIKYQWGSLHRPPALILVMIFIVLKRCSRPVCPCTSCR